MGVQLDFASGGCRAHSRALSRSWVDAVGGPKTAHPLPEPTTPAVDEHNRQGCVADGGTRLSSARQHTNVRICRRRSWLRLTPTLTTIRNSST